MHPRARRDLEDKLPDIDIIRTEGIHHTYPAGANTAIENLSKDYMFLSHTDMLMSHNWLTALVQDLENIENSHKVPAATQPLLIPYPRLDTTPDYETKLGSRITRSALQDKNTALDYMALHDLPHAPWKGRDLVVCCPGLITDNGWRLGGAYMASKRFFDEVGLYDPLINRANDKAYAIKALMTNCKVMTSNKVYLHHIGGIHGYSGCYGEEGYYEDGEHKSYTSKEFGGFHQIKKTYGMTVWRKIRDGSIWRELHQAQLEGKSRELIEKYRKMG